MWRIGLAGALRWLTCLVFLLSGSSSAQPRLLLKRREGAPISGRVLLGILLLLMVIGVDSQCGPKNWHASFRREKVAQGNAAAGPADA